MKKELTQIEIVRFETSYDDETLDCYTEEVRALCKAFSFHFKIFNQHLEGADILRYYDIYIPYSSFHIEELRSVVKTFILINGMRIMHIKSIEMDFNEYLEMPDETFEEENLIRYIPQR